MTQTKITPTERFCFCNNEVSLQMVSGGAAKEGYLGKITLKINGEYVDYVKSPTVESEPHIAECNCNLRTKLVGDGCEKCNPQLTIDLLSDEIAELKKRVNDLDEQNDTQAIYIDNYMAKIAELEAKLKLAREALEKVSMVGGAAKSYAEEALNKIGDK